MLLAAKIDTVRSVEKIDSVNKMSQLPKKVFRLFRRGRTKLINSNEPESFTDLSEQETKSGIISSLLNKPDTQDIRTLKKKIYELQSINHSYVAVPGIKGRCTELRVINGHLVAGTNNGLFEISENRSIVLLPNKYIQFISTALQNTIIFAGTGESLFVLKHLDGKWEVIREFDALGFTMYSACMTDPNTLWIGSDNSVYKLSVDRDFLIDDILRINVNTQFSDIANVKLINDSIYIFLSSGIYKIDNNMAVPTLLFNDLTSLPTFYLNNDQIAIYCSREKWSVINDQVKLPLEYLNIFTSVQDISLSSDSSMWIIANNNQIYKVAAKKLIPESDKFEVFFASLKGRGNANFSIEKPDIQYSESSLRIDFSAPFYVASSKTEFRYYIKGLNSEWSPWSSSSSVEYPLLPPGTYNVYVQARNIFGSESEESSLTIHVKPPFYKTKLFYALVIILIIGVFILVVRIREKSLLHAKEILEQKVRERTTEIERQKNELAEQKKEITDSIFYAKRIQSAVLPSIPRLKTYLSEHFVLFLPRDIVSGDFYWSTVKDHKVVIAAADCTGHGVPGAFMSMLGVSFLNEIVNRISLMSAGEILDTLRSSVMETLSQSGDQEQRDGMDIALCIIDKNAMKLEFAGANNPMYMIRNNLLTQICGDKMPIGTYERNDNFTTNEINLKKGDTFYLFSDGFIDQFGGDNGKKYLSKNFRQILLRIHEQPMNKQKELLGTEFFNWKGKLHQVDDVLIIGIRM